MTTKDSTAVTLAALQALIAGTQKHTPNGQFTFGNASFTTASLIQTIQGLIDAMSARAGASASYKVAIQSAKDEGTKVSPTVSAYRKYLVATYGNAVDILASYGLAPPKQRRPLTAEEMLAAAKQNSATRAARGTVGPKKKLAIKGVVAEPAQPMAATASVQASAQPALASAPTPPAKPTP